MPPLLPILLALALAASVACADEAAPLGPTTAPPAASALEASPPRQITLDHPLVRTVGSLAVVLGLIFTLAAVARRLHGKSAGSLAAAFGLPGAAPSPSGILEVLGRFPVGRGQTLILLRVDTRILLLAQSTPGLRIRGGPASGGIVTLAQFTDAEEVASILMKVQDADQASTAARFGELLGRFDARHAEFNDAGTPDGVVDLTSARRPTPVAPLATGGGSLKARLGAMRGGL